MATAVTMPRQGQSVESCLIVAWKKKVGDQVAEGEILCEVETDKALLEVESPVAGTLLALFFGVGDEVPVLTNIAAVGEPTEEVDSLRPQATGLPDPAPKSEPQPRVVLVEPEVETAAAEPSSLRISPRARNLAGSREIEMSSLQGTGPSGRIIERDVQAALAAEPRMTPLAKTMIAKGDFDTPSQGTGIDGRIMARDLSVAPAEPLPPGPVDEEEIETIPVKGVRKLIAERMLQSLQTTAQLTLNASADARGVLAYRKRLKRSKEALGLKKVTVNDLILFVVSRTLPWYPALNARFNGDTIAEYRNVHLGFAVDTPRGLMVPVIRVANNLSLLQIGNEARRLATAAQSGSVLPDEMNGGTFTVTNLGNLGVESFTPLLNPPQVAILGVGSINLRPIEVDGEVQFIPHINLSLTINHQVVDGAPAARFLQELSQGLADVELLLAL